MIIVRVATDHLIGFRAHFLNDDTLKERITTMNILTKKVVAVLAGSMLMAQVVGATSVVTYTNEYSGNGILMSTHQNGTGNLTGNMDTTCDVLGRTISQRSQSNGVTINTKISYNALGEVAQRISTQNSTGTNGDTGVKTTITTYSNHGASSVTKVKDTANGDDGFTTQSVSTTDEFGATKQTTYGSDNSEAKIDYFDSYGNLFKTVDHTLPS